MPSSSPWLATLQRIREHRRDAALQSLAKRLRVATKIHGSVSSLETMISRLGQVQQQSSQAGQLDSERLRQIRQGRDELRSHWDNLASQQRAADAAVQLAQTDATAKDAESEVLRRLKDRLDSAERQAQRGRDEQSLLEVAVSLCNGRPSD